MLKKLGIPTLAVIAMLAIVGAAPAQAGVHFGIGIGGPVYTYPSPYAYSYPYGYYNPYPYYSTPYYSAPYVYPYGGYYGGWGWGHDRDGGRYEHHDRGFRGHEGGGYRGGHEGGHRR
jgi:hypothetical protein